MACQVLPQATRHPLTSLAVTSPSSGRRKSRGRPGPWAPHAPVPASCTPVLSTWPPHPGDGSPAVSPPQGPQGPTILPVSPGRARVSRGGAELNIGALGGYSPPTLSLPRPPAQAPSPGTGPAPLLSTCPRSAPSPASSCSARGRSRPAPRAPPSPAPRSPPAPRPGTPRARPGHPRSRRHRRNPRPPPLPPPPPSLDPSAQGGKRRTTARGRRGGNGTAHPSRDAAGGGDSECDPGGTGGEDTLGNQSQKERGRGWPMGRQGEGRGM